MDRPKIKAKLKLKLKLKQNWSSTETTRHILASFPPKSKYAIFDLDGTLMTLNGTEPIVQVVEYLKQCHTDGYCIIVLSNQYGITKGTTTHQEVQKRFSVLSIVLGLQPGKDISYIYATTKDQYRKPMTGMFNIVCPNGATDDSFYCGDAVGRSGDFAVSDFYFAKNCGLKCISAPELKLVTDSSVVQKYKLYEDLGQLDKWVLELERNHEFEPGPGPGPELVLLVGPQGCGKSTLAKRFLNKGYTVLNRDTIGSTGKLQKMYATCLKNKANVVIDNTNYSKTTRSQYIKAAEASGYTVRIYYFDIPKLLSFHMCHLRVQLGGPRIPPVAIHTYYKRLEPPIGGNLVVFKGLLGPVPDEYNWLYNLKER